MKMSLTSWSFPACTLNEAVGLSRLLGIGALDLGYFYGAALDKSALLADPEDTARKVRDLGLDVPSLFHLFGDSLVDRNLADPASFERNLTDFHRVARFCVAAGIATIFVLPGMTNPGQGKREALESSARALTALAEVASSHGLILTVEPHVHSYLDSPALTLELLRRVPALRLTLDYAHFVCMGFRQEEIDVLAPYAAHVHLRQARPGYLQTKLDHGVIDFPAMLALLGSHRYSGAVSIEYVHQTYMNTLYEDVLTETIGMRNLVRRWSAQKGES